MNPEIKTAIGRLPTFWNRNIIFFANLPGLFYGNEGEIKNLKKLVDGLESYGGRLAPIINLMFQGNDNVLILETKPDESLIHYFIDSLGLKLPSIEVLPYSVYHSFSELSSNRVAAPFYSLINHLSDHSAQTIDGFVTDKALSCVAKRLQKSTINTEVSSKAGNNKFLLHQFLLKNDLPLFDTCIAESVADVFDCLNNLHCLGYTEAVIKAQIGASGIGMLKLDTSIKNARDIPEYLFYEGPALVQGWLDRKVKSVRFLGSPSIQIFLNNDTLFLYDLTEQILSPDSIHEGNFSPPEYITNNTSFFEQINELGKKAGMWLHDSGYRGTASIDFHIIERKGNVEVRICEINARVTGATYPAILARHFMPEMAWLMRNIKFFTSLTGLDLLDILKRNNKLYIPGNERGILPINFNFDENKDVNKGQFLFLGRDLQECTSLLSQMDLILPVAWGYDRD